MIKVGLLGAGGIGKVHARAYDRIAGARIVAVADSVRERAEALAAPLQAHVYEDWRPVLDDPQVEMVDICLPTYLHEAAVVAAAQAGKHILSEKPVTLSLPQADRMIAAVERAGVHAMIAQVIRFWPHYLAIKGMIERGDLGAPIMAQAARLGSLPAWSSWYADPALSGGALLDLHIHDLDWLFYLFGMPKTVYAIGRQLENGAWNQILTSLDFGATKAAAEASLLMPKGFPFTMTFRILGDKGYAEYRSGGIQADPHAAARTHSLVVSREDRELEYVTCADDDPYEAEIRYFVACLNEGRAPSVATLTEARCVLQIALAVRQSLQTGKVVALA